jgi:alkane 1-monooxygenase
LEKKYNFGKKYTAMSFSALTIRPLKYTGVLILPAILYLGMLKGGWWTFSGLIFAFGLIPLAELFLPASEKNLDKVEEAMVKNDRIYDFLVYAIVPIQYILVFLTMYIIGKGGLVWYEYVGFISALGLACGVFGINVGHELGHRNKKYEQFMAKLLLLTSLYMHFFIEHNRGHHKHVSTEEDPASARRGEILYTFWFRSVIGGYLSAWKLENDRLRKIGKSPFSIHNEMIIYQIVQVAFVAFIGFVFGWIAMLCFIASAIFGFLLLETVNYIEHYGLSRKKMDNGGWEKTMPTHSWNSNHPIGRILLFELSRHSDHHYIANRPYQILRHFDESPQMPTGYPGMMILAFFPPLWFAVMDKRIDKLKETTLELA